MDIEYHVSTPSYGLCRLSTSTTKVAAWCFHPNEGPPGPVTDNYRVLTSATASMNWLRTRPKRDVSRHEIRQLKI
eukprot:4896312-Pleurochrysis_carterae.AAC.1